MSPVFFPRFFGPGSTFPTTLPFSIILRLSSRKAVLRRPSWTSERQAWDRLEQKQTDGRRYPREPIGGAHDVGLHGQELAPVAARQHSVVDAFAALVTAQKELADDVAGHSRP